MSFSEDRKKIYEICKYMSPAMIEELESLGTIILFTDRDELVDWVNERVDNGKLPEFNRNVIPNMLELGKFVVYDIEYDDVKWYRELYDVVASYMDTTYVVDKYHVKK